MGEQSYRLLEDSKIEPSATKGTIVYDIHGYDYGLASDDTMLTGIEHKSVSLKPDGGYPFFTIPRRALEKIKP